MEWQISFKFNNKAFEHHKKKKKKKGLFCITSIYRKKENISLHNIPVFNINFVPYSLFFFLFFKILLLRLVFTDNYKKVNLHNNSVFQISLFPILYLYSWTPTSTYKRRKKRSVCIIKHQAASDLSQVVL